MAQRTLRRFVTAGVLAAVLAVTAAGPAQARDLRTAHQAWSWLQDLWAQSVSALWPWGGDPAPAPEAGGAGGLWKEGNGLDPNGSTHSGTSTPQPPPSTSGDAGNGVDPDG